MRLAKSLPVSIFIVGHVTKEGVVAGPKTLEHMVDTVLYFEGDGGASYRFLRGVKNRFGPTDEIGVFEMCADGLKEVLNPSEYMLQGKPENEPGSVVTCSMEGTRPILAEVQALVCQTNFNMPRRATAGTDYNRVNLLMAVIEKRLGVRMGDYDAYINVAGGMRISEPALDLGIVAAILSSYRNQAFDSKTVCFGEVGLTGEIRAVNLAEQRVMEAAKLGFKRCIMPKANSQKLNIKESALNGMQLRVLAVFMNCWSNIMGLRENETNTEHILERMENTMNNLEQMSYDSINITDRLVTLLSEGREHAAVMKSGTEEERDKAHKLLCDILDNILETAFTVNNIAHELERETIYQRDTVEAIKQIVDFFYSMTDDIDL